ncbi:hypothetical protein BGX31_007375 [Mortierella sp. GBA43]|nr:hypothetical protein BGX31_007375 [Mortierella sp. GBA43]
MEALCPLFASIVFNECSQKLTALSSLCSKLLELQEGLKDLLKRVATVHEEHDKKKEENAMLQKVIANLMNSNAVIGDIASK